MQGNRKNLVEDAQWYDTVREWRWPEGRQCPFCESKRVIKRGFDENEPARQRYACHVCAKRFDDLTGTICAGHHHPLKVWILCLSFMGLNWSNDQIAKELDLDHSDVHQMTTQLREGIVKKSLTSRYLERERATRSTAWQATQAILWPCSSRDEQGVGIACEGNGVEAP